MGSFQTIKYTGKLGGHAGVYRFENIETGGFIHLGAFQLFGTDDGYLGIHLGHFASNDGDVYQRTELRPAGEPEAGLYPVEISSASVIENLQSLNFIDFHTNPAFILEKAELLEDLFLLEKGYDVNRLSKFELERARSEQSSGMPEIINSLHELKGVFERPGVNKKKEIARMPQEAKYLLAFAKTEFNVVNKLLCLFDTHNFVRRYYSDAGALERELLQMPLAKKYYILKYLSGELRRSDVIND